MQKLSFWLTSGLFFCASSAAMVSASGQTTPALLTHLRPIQAADAAPPSSQPLFARLQRRAVAGGFLLGTLQPEALQASSFRLPLPQQPDAIYTVSRSRPMPGLRVWTLHAPGATGHLVYSERTHNLSGNACVHADCYRIETFGDTVALVHLAPVTGLLLDQPDQGTSDGERPGTPPGRSRQPDASAAPAQISLLFYYTPAALACSNNDIAAKVAEEMAQLNDALINSGLANVQVTSIATPVAFQYSEAGLDKDTISQDLIDDNVAAINGVRAAGGDLAITLVCRGENPPDLVVGAAPIGPNISSPAAWVDVGESATNIFVFPHEWAHMLGAEHKDGFVWHASYIQEYRTVMTYATDCKNQFFSCDVIDQFSNPSISYEGDPTGDATHNTAAIIESHAQQVANFRDLPQLRYGEPYAVQNDYGNWGGGFLDVDGYPCSGSYCVSTGYSEFNSPGRQPGCSFLHKASTPATRLWPETSFTSRVWRRGPPAPIC